MTQPTALYLADVIANDPCSKAHHDAAAAELRRLHDDYENALKHFAEVVDGYKQMAAQRDELLAALKLMLASHDATCPGEECQLSGVDLARAAIAKAQQ